MLRENLKAGDIPYEAYFSVLKKNEINQLNSL